MPHAKNFRVYFLLAVLLLFGTIVLLGDRRPNFLRPGLHLHAYVGSAIDGNITVIDIVNLRAIGKIAVGPAIGDILEHPKRDEIWGVSSIGGYLWVIDTHTDQLSARVPVGGLPYSLDFSRKGDRVYTTISAANQVLTIECATRAILGRARTGAQPVRARITPDNKTLLVVNHGSATLGIHDAATLQQRAEVPVIPNPEEVVAIPDGTIAFVMSSIEKRLSVVDIRRGVLITNLELAGKPTQMLLKPDGGELYVLSPEAHTLQVVNTWTHELGDSLTIGSSPTTAILSEDVAIMYVADREANRVFPVDILNRRVGRPINVGVSPGAMRFDPAESGAHPSMLLVANEASGDVAIIRARTDSLLTMIQAGSHPQRLAIKLF